MRRARQLTLWCITISACTSAPAPILTPIGPDLSPVHYAATEQDLRLASHRINETTIQGQKTVVGAHLDYSLHAAASANGSTRAISFGIDVRHRADGQIFDLVPAADLSGTTLSSSIDDAGQLGDFELSRSDLDADPALGQITAVLRQFFPRIPKGGIMPSTTWTDSTTLSRAQQGADITVAGTTRFSAGSWSDTTADRTLLVDWVRTYTVTGTGEQAGLTFTIVGNGVSTGTHRFGSEGKYLGTIASDSTVSELDMSSLGMIIPLVQLGADTIRVIN